MSHIPHNLTIGVRPVRDFWIDDLAFSESIGETFLHRLVAHRDIEKHLSALEIFLKLHPHLINQRDFFHRTPYEDAIRLGKPKVAEILKKQGADTRISQLFFSTTR